MTITDDSLADTMPYHASPPLAPGEPPLSSEQIRFMWLHARHTIVKWHWQFQGAQLRAYADKGMTATISDQQLDSLVEQGLMLRGHGCADVLLTDAGMELAR